MRKLFYILLASLLFSTAFATTVNFKDDQSIPLNFYVGIQPGYINTHYDRKWLTRKSGFTSCSSVDSYGFFSRFLLGYDFNRYFALEAGYIYISKVVYNNINASAKSGEFRQEVIDFLAKGSLPFNNQFGLFMKVGAAYLHRDTLRVAVSGTILDTNSNDQTYVPTIGAGMYLNFTKHFYGDIGYQYYRSNLDFRAMDLVSLSLAYKL